MASIQGANSVGFTFFPGSHRSGAAPSVTNGTTTATPVGGVNVQNDGCRPSQLPPNMLVEAALAPPAVFQWDAFGPHSAAVSQTSPQAPPRAPSDLAAAAAALQANNAAMQAAMDASLANNAAAINNFGHVGSLQRELATSHVLLEKCHGEITDLQCQLSHRDERTATLRSALARSHGRVAELQVRLAGLEETSHSQAKALAFWKQEAEQLTAQLASQTAAGSHGRQSPVTACSVADMCAPADLRALTELQAQNLHLQTQLLAGQTQAMTKLREVHGQELQMAQERVQAMQLQHAQELQAVHSKHEQELSDARAASAQGAAR